MDNSTKLFGEFVKEKRMSQSISLRGMAYELGISPTYWSDIEKGRRNPPESKLGDVVDILKLSDTDQDTMYNYAGFAKDIIPPDIKDYVLEEEVIRALRKAKNTATKEDWARFVEELEKKGQQT